MCSHKREDGLVGGEKDVGEERDLIDLGARLPCARLAAGPSTSRAGALNYANYANCALSSAPCQCAPALGSRIDPVTTWTPQSSVQ